MQLRMLSLLCALLGTPLLVPAQVSADTGLRLREQKKFVRASGELLLTQLAPWSYNRFARQAEFAKVDLTSVGYNLGPSSWEWDDNNFKTNQFGHPYHGNLYYSTFRSNGYSFWQSAPAAFAGSFIWEIAGETHRPAPNDFINTSLGGISLGEMTYRLSNKIVNNEATGFRRQFQEVMGLLVNPANGLNRILDGHWGRVYGDPDSTTGVEVTLDAGMRRFGVRTLQRRVRGDNELYFRLKLEYGAAFQPSHTPFETFAAVIEAGAGDSAYLNTIQVSGALKTWTMKETRHQHHLYSISMNYDYIQNGAFEYGGQSFILKVLSDWNKGGRFGVRSEIGSGIVVLGAVPDKYLYYGEGRNYDYGPGLSVLAGLTLNAAERVEASLNYRGRRFQTVNGNRSSYILNTLTADIRVSPLKHLWLAAGIGQYTLNGFYKDLDNVSEIYPFGRFSIGYHF